MKASWLAAFGLALLLMAAVTGLALAAPPFEHAITWQVIAAGGAPASGGAITLNGTLGQTAVALSASADYSVGSGYWSAGNVIVIPTLGESIYLPAVYNMQSQ
jgi:hypothetical protein